MERQTLMFSATFPDNIIKFSKQYLQNPERVCPQAYNQSPSENIIRDNIFVEQPKKFNALMEQLSEREGVIVFARTQVSAERLS